MKIYNSGFIGSENFNLTFDFSGGDNKFVYDENVLKMPNDWYYKDKKITYKYNNYGHRSKNINEINLDNYILVTGCSHTEGIGVELEKTYGYVLANKLKCDYYNLALGATGIDVVLHNLVIWFSTIKKQPKAVIIQWPDFTRLITGTHTDYLEPRGMWMQLEDYNRFVNLGINLNFFEAKKILAHYLVQNMIKCPIVYFGISKIIPFNDDTIIKPIIDYGRDCSHPGILSHQSFSDSIYDYLINN